MNTHGTTYYVIRAFIRFIFFSSITAGIIIGVPMAVEAIWPAILLSAVLWAIVIGMAHRERQRRMLNGAS